MNELIHPALLPLGVRDLLPPEAAAEAQLVGRLMAVLAGHGYERVKPPLFEFEESLFSGPGGATVRESFRLMDTVSERVIGLRADMTPQVARIASTRLAHAPRPLRLCYAGQVLRAKGGPVRSARQIGQVGAELFGIDAAAADVEVIALAAEALAELEIEGVSVDLTLPALVPAICKAHGVDGEAAQAIRAALDHKDAARLAEIGGKAAPILGRLLAAAGPADKALAVLKTLALPAEAKDECDRLAAVIGLLRERRPELGLTIDPVENRAFEYQTGISFTFFARHVRSELGRGGRYISGSASAPEPATGFSLFTDTLSAAMPAAAGPRRIYLPAGVEAGTGRSLRAEGWVTVAGLAPVADDAAEGRRLRCGHALIDGKITDLS